MKTSELEGTALDWAVAKAIGEYKPVAVPNYSTSWAQGGPIIELERICLRDTGEDGDLMWEADDQRDAVGKYRGPTPLIAAMRCYVASVLGDEVEVPDSLTNI
jgi:hypothetical protein